MILATYPLLVLFIGVALLWVSGLCYALFIPHDTVLERQRFEKWRCFLFTTMVVPAFLLLTLLLQVSKESFCG
jgi:hypothetical protein